MSKQFLLSHKQQAYPTKIVINGRRLHIDILPGDTEAVMRELSDSVSEAMRKGFEVMKNVKVTKKVNCEPLSTLIIQG